MPYIAVRIQVEPERLGRGCIHRRTPELIQVVVEFEDLIPSLRDHIVAVDHNVVPLGVHEATAQGDGAQIVSVPRVQLVDGRVTGIDEQVPVRVAGDGIDRRTGSCQPQGATCSIVAGNESQVTGRQGLTSEGGSGAGVQ